MAKYLSVCEAHEFLNKVSQFKEVHTDEADLATDMKLSLVNYRNLRKLYIHVINDNNFMERIDEIINWIAIGVDVEGALKISPFMDESIGMAISWMLTHGYVVSGNYVNGCTRRYIMRVVNSAHMILL